MATPHSLRPLVPFLILTMLAASEPARAQEQAPPSWKDLKQLLKERKPEAALQGTEERSIGRTGALLGVAGGSRAGGEGR